MRTIRRREDEEDEGISMKRRGGEDVVGRRRGKVTHITTAHVHPASEMEMRETHTTLITLTPAAELG